jgi:SAM-dependent methyltransferase
MVARDKTLTAIEAQAYYNWFGKKQDSQGFYENPALDDLIAHANFQDARMVFEFGCGTGKLAERLLNEYLPSSASYLCCDVSPVMVGLTKKRLDKHSKRVKVRQSDGTVYFPQPNHSTDRVISSYVLDLLSDGDIKSFFYEAHRVLIRGGRVCLVSLTNGITLPSRIVSSLWTAVFNIRPSVVGGCRPIIFDTYVDRNRWHLEYRKVVTPFGVPSEVLVLIARSVPSKANAADTHHSRR